MRKKTKKRNGLREIPDDLWNLIEPILPPDKPPATNGRPRVPNRIVLNGILYVLRTGCCGSRWCVPGFESDRRMSNA